MVMQNDDTKRNVWQGKNIAFNVSGIGEVQKCYFPKLNKVLLLGFLYLFLRCAEVQRACKKKNKINLFRIYFVYTFAIQTQRYEKANTKETKSDC